jgi:TolA-binding protein
MSQEQVDAGDGGSSPKRARIDAGGEDLAAQPVTTQLLTAQQDIARLQCRVGEMERVIDGMQEQLGACMQQQRQQQQQWRPAPIDPSTPPTAGGGQQRTGAAVARADGESPSTGKLAAPAMAAPQTNVRPASPVRLV